MPYVQNPRDLLQKSQSTVDRVNQTDLNIRQIMVEEDLRNEISSHLAKVGGSSITEGGIEIIENDELLDNLPTPHSLTIPRNTTPPTAQRPIYRVPDTPEEFDRAERSRLSNNIDVEVLAF